MLNANHPDDERLSALAAHDPDASEDETLTRHVADCSRCADIVGELQSLSVALAELPDVAPPRPLRLLPEVAPAPPDGVAVWAKRLFGPVMAAGAALALVGMVGTASPSLNGSMAAGGAEEHQSTASDANAYAQASQAAAPAVGGESLRSSAGDVDEPRTGEGEPGDDNSAESPETETETERPIWPMVLFTGVALLIGGALLRWILVPRAG